MKNVPLILIAVLFFSLPCLAIETVTIPKENYHNLRILISSLNLKVEGKACADYSTIMINDIKPVLKSMLEQLHIMADYCRPMTDAEEIGCLKDEISILKMRLIKLEGKK